MKDEDIHHAANEPLGQVGDTRTVEPLVTALKDEDYDVRWASAEALGGIGAPAVEQLIATIKDEDKNVRVAAAKMLVTIYKSDRLGTKDKKAILSQENDIKHLGRNWQTDVEYSCPYSHEDHGSYGFYINFAFLTSNRLLEN